MSRPASREDLGYIPLLQINGRFRISIGDLREQNSAYSSPMPARSGICGCKKYLPQFPFRAGHFMTGKFVSNKKYSLYRISSASYLNKKFFYIEEISYGIVFGKRLKKYPCYTSGNLHAQKKPAQSFLREFFYSNSYLNYFLASVFAGAAAADAAGAEALIAVITS